MEAKSTVSVSVKKVWNDYDTNYEQLNNTDFSIVSLSTYMLASECAIVLRLVDDQLPPTGGGRRLQGSKDSGAQEHVTYHR